MMNISANKRENKNQLVKAQQNNIDIMNSKNEGDLLHFIDCT